MELDLHTMFSEAKIMGHVVQDLNHYKCPSCSSPFFVRGMDSYLHYVQCIKSDCQRLDIIGPTLAPENVINKIETETDANQG